MPIDTPTAATRTLAPFRSFMAARLDADTFTAMAELRPKGLDGKKDRIVLRPETSTRVDEVALYALESLSAGLPAAARRVWRRHLRRRWPHHRAMPAMCERLHLW